MCRTVLLSIYKVGYDGLIINLVDSTVQRKGLSDFCNLTSAYASVLD